MFTDYLSDVAERLDHVRGHVEYNPKIEKLVANINANVPHKNACLLLLSSQALGEAILAWFERHDISNFKNWLFTAAEIDRMSYLAETNTSAPAAKFLQLLKPLVSDNVSLISWFSNYDSAYDAKRIEDPKTEDFFAYQAIIALRGDWSRLKLRCDNVNGKQALGQVAKKYFLDTQFYEALSRKDVTGMQRALTQMVTPKVMHARRNFESGFTEGCISTYPVIYSKIAYFHGMDLNIESRYIPSNWLPIAPNVEYDFQFALMKR
jgi:hypothetical protein